MKRTLPWIGNWPTVREWLFSWTWVPWTGFALALAVTVLTAIHFHRVHQYKQTLLRDVLANPTLFDPDVFATSNSSGIGWVFLVGISFSMVLFLWFYNLVAERRSASMLVANSQLSLEETRTRLENMRKMAQTFSLNQKRLELAIEAARIGIWEWDLHAKKFLFSSSWRKLCGEPDSLMEESEAVSMQRVHPEDAAHITSELNKLIQGQTQLARFEFRLRHAQGHYLDVESVVRVALSDDQHRPTHLVGVSHDVTDRIRLEQESMRNSKLESIGLLAGGLAHDLNNILAVVVGSLDMVIELKPEAEVREKTLGRAREACNRATRMTRELLTFAKGGAPVKTVLDIGKLVGETADLCFHGSNCRLHAKIINDLWPIEGDPHQLGQVLQNVIINGLQAMPDGGHLHLACSNVSAVLAGPESILSMDHVMCVIRDEGCGIPSEILDKVFDPYFTTKSSGTGLGLATTYSVIRKHGGTINIRSEEGSGTEITIRLPAVPEETPRSENTAATAKDIVAGLHVLILDDEPDITQLLSQMLASMVIQTDCCDDAETAIKLLFNPPPGVKQFDAALLDLTLPSGRGGRHVVEACKAALPHLKFIAMSGYHNDPIMSDHAAYGFDAAMQKPFGKAELKNTFAALFPLQNKLPD